MPPLSAGMYGFKLVVDKYLTEVVIERNSPKDRFIEYGPEDDRHGRFMGWVKDVVRPSPTVYQMGDSVIGHPDTLAAMVKYLKDEEEQRRELFELPEPGPKRHV